MRGEMGENPTEKDYVVTEENWPALELFMSLTTQWRTSFSGVTGLDYTAVISVIKLTARKKDRVELFEKVKLIERGALKELNKGDENASEA